MSRRRNRSRDRRDLRQNYTPRQNGGPAGALAGSTGAQGSDRVLDRHEVERQNALQVSEAAERAGAIVEDQIESIMDQAEAGAEAVRRNAEQDAANIKQEASGAAMRVVERVESLSGSLGELAAELKREVETLHAAPAEREAAPEQQET